MTGTKADNIPVDIPFTFEIPTDLTINGRFEVSNVAFHSTLGGIFPFLGTASDSATSEFSTATSSASIVASFSRLLVSSKSFSLLDHSVFSIIVEDEPREAINSSADGKFQIKALSMRDQIVVRAVNKRLPALYFEWMAANSSGLYGKISAEITVFSTARSFIARTVRERYGRRVIPEALPDSLIRQTSEAIFNVLEKHPELLQTAKLEEIPDVQNAISIAAEYLHTNNMGEYPRDWTFLIYQGGDNSMFLPLKKRLEEIRALKLQSRMTVLVQTDLSDRGITRIWYNEGKETVLGSVGQANSADPMKIADLLAFSRRVFPARRYALFLASHGTGWRAPSILNTSLSSNIVFDDPENSSIDMVSLKLWLLGAEKVGTSFQRPLDLLVLDAGNMASLETAYQLKDAALYQVFSQGNMPSEGLPYPDFLARISKITDLEKVDGKSVGNHVIDSFKSIHLLSAKNLSTAISMIESGKLQAFVEHFSNWTDYIFQNNQTVLFALANLRDALKAEGELLKGTQKFRIQAFEMTDYRDLLDLVNGLVDVSPQTLIVATPVLKSFSEMLVRNEKTGDKYPDANGLSISFPTNFEFSQYFASDGKSIPYTMLDISAAAKWDELIYMMTANPLPRVEGRKLQIDLSWKSPSDFDLWIGEPSTAPQTDTSNVVWSSSADGMNSQYGQFSPDSTVTKLSEEFWKANTRISLGKYTVMATARTENRSVPHGILKTKISYLGTENTFETDFRNSSSEKIAIIEVGTFSIDVSPYPVPSSSSE
ncbi:MAG: hypothetical protein HQM10_02970 [Candidatus Riflebacteria bacterium]|nr:hypothetical protein [Candidatus Riflebacteria bacterium]